MRICIGNWKMNGDKETVHKISQVLNNIQGSISTVKVVVCVPYTLLYEARREFNSVFEIGAQCICPYAEKGSYTGGIGPYQIKDAGVNTVLIGHSEREKYFHETEEEIRDQLKIAIKNGLNIILCVGEYEKDGSTEETSRIIRNRLDIIKTLEINSSVIIAYEPVWAIGTGDVPSAERIQSTVNIIHDEVGNRIEGILYGGSVTKDSVQNLLSIKNLSGFLVGNASLSEEFASICEILSKNEQSE
ncbi:triosephosphate isomerase (TIM) [Nematocida sp. ERTm5]|nr:triosephosphate isomerase (TIM) [Nematocida sp. ERTm5]